MTVDIDPDVVHTEIAMQVLDRMIPDILEENGPAVRARFYNALLNLAVSRLVAAEGTCLLYTSPSPRARTRSRMPSSA